ncbi:MAG TPA: transglutaminase domain-containing protein [Anaeromyxobacter sp.]|nr:transglutaminase domain-containing protein [Anaeromyxobacter sp.]
MNRPLRFLLPALVAGLVACPEQRTEPRGERPPQATLSAGASPPLDVLTLRRPGGPEWYGVYLAGKKAGYQENRIDREIRDGREVVVARSEQLVKASVGGKQVERGESEERVYEARPGGRLLSFQTTFRGDGGDRQLFGSCIRDRCTVRIQAPGTPAEQRILEGVTETVEQADPARLAAERRATVRGRQIETLKLRVREMEDVYQGRQAVAGGGVQEEVSVVSETEVGDRLAIEYRVADDGRIVEVTEGEAIVIRPETEAQAKSLEDVDLLELGRVPLPRPVPRQVPAAVTYRLSGLPTAFWKNDARQRYEKGPGGTALLTVTARPPAAADPARDTPLSKAADGADREDLEPTLEADADAPAVAALARQVAGGAPGAYAAARLLSDHVYKLLKKAYGASHDRASDVLVAEEGDCTEHSILTVALARALHIPAREVQGLVYARYADGQDALYWHAWVEIRSAGEWIAIDPTFGQAVADASHIALGSGNRLDTVGLLGSLKVADVEVRETTARGRPAPAKEPRTR